MRICSSIAPWQQTESHRHSATLIFARLPRAWIGSVPDHELFLSVLVLGEIRKGIELAKTTDPAKTGALGSWLHETETIFADRVLPVTASVADRWGRLCALRPISTVDGLLAATALVHDLTLVTRDVHGVAHTGVSLLNPFAPS